MAGMGPLPKPMATRQRTNRQSTRATLVALPEAQYRSQRVPPLPKRDPESGQPEWHALTKVWWRDIWRSPMAAEYLKADTHGLYVLAEIVDRFWHKPSVEGAAEIRQQRQHYGLTPLDRRRLEWTVQRVEEGARRSPPPPSRQSAAGDPRSLLEVVS